VNWDEMAVVGQIARTHGIRGHVVVNLETDFPDARFHPGAELFMKRRGAQVDVERIILTTVRFHQGRPIIGIEGVDDMNAATMLAGAELRVPVDRLTVLPDGTFYRHDLVGCAVETVSGHVVGTVKAVEGAVDGSRLVVDGERGEILVPLVSDICTAIDPEAKRIVIAPPEGLLELNEREKADRKS
jgi:16S rRNA processing protein RimM